MTTESDAEWRRELRLTEANLKARHDHEIAELKDKVARIVERFGVPAQFYTRQDLADKQNVLCLKVNVDNLIQKLRSI